MTTSHAVLAVLTIGGHDPSGGAGIQADIETLGALRVHSYTLITALTAQDTTNVMAIWPQTPTALLHQARILLADVAIDVVKIGMLATADLARAVRTILNELSRVTVVLDPVLAAGGGAALANAELIDTIREQLLPKTTVLTPNGPELATLTGGSEPAAAAVKIHQWGCPWTLLTGGHDVGEQGTNRLYHRGELVYTESWPRRARQFHGSGCTFAAAVAGYLARGCGIPEAARGAQAYTQGAITTAIEVGRGQSLPNRLPAAAHDRSP